MSSLREIKERISSVRTTLKITGAMKLVAAAKLRKAERAMEVLQPFRDTLASIYAQVQRAADASSKRGGGMNAPADLACLRDGAETAENVEVAEISEEADGADVTENAEILEEEAVEAESTRKDRTAIVAFASNSSLCGAFNGNVLRKVEDLLKDCGGNADVLPLGRKIAEPLRKLGCLSETLHGLCEAGVCSDKPSGDLSRLVSHPNFQTAAALADSLADACGRGVYSEIILVYTHFVSTIKQEVRVEKFLPYLPEKQTLEGEEEDYFLLEPSAGEILERLLPQMLRLKFYSVVLDSVSAEHAARTVAMQTASDNASELLDELTLEYNKDRQQQITAEILDIVGGSQQ